MTKACAECGQPFEPYLPKAATQRFCSPWCRAEWHRRQYQEVRDWWRQVQAQPAEEERA